MNKRLKDMLMFTRAGLIMTVIGYFWSILIYDVINLRAIFAYWIGIPLFWGIRYYVYSKSWKKGGIKE